MAWMDSEIGAAVDLSMGGAVSMAWWCCLLSEIDCCTYKYLGFFDSWLGEGVKGNNLHGKLILISSSLHGYNLGQNTKQIMYVLEAWTYGGGTPKFSHWCHSFWLTNYIMWLHVTGISAAVAMKKYEITSCGARNEYQKSDFWCEIIQ